MLFQTQLLSVSVECRSFLLFLKIEYFRTKSLNDLDRVRIEQDEYLHKIMSSISDSPEKVSATFFDSESDEV